MKELLRFGAAVLFGILIIWFAWIFICVGETDETPVYTEIVLDGDPSDWTDYDVLSDSPFDARGDVEITGLRVFANDSYLYVLVEIDAAGIGDYAQLDVDINPRHGLPEFMANAIRGQSVLNIGRFENGERFEIDTNGELATGTAFEMRFPLQAFGSTVPERVAVRVMGGTCCGPEWVMIDATSPARVAVLDEVEMPFFAQADLRARDSAFCRCQEPPTELEEASHINVPDGYRAEYFVAPSGLNCPSDVAVTSTGTIYVTSRRNGQILEISDDGNTTVYCEASVYSIDLDARDQLYGYDMPSGQIFSITKNRHRLIARVPETACESTLAVAPDGTLYIGHNFCSGDVQGVEATIYRIKPGGGDPEVLLRGWEFVNALDVDSHGNLYAASKNGLFSINPRNGEARQICGNTHASFHGLVATDDGTLYFSTGDFAESGGIFRVSPEGGLTELAAFTGNGIEGIALTADGEVVGVQRAIGGLQRVLPDGTIEVLVEPNGLTSPQSLTISPCGDVLVVNDEAGWSSVVCADGSVRAFAKMCSFQPPQTCIAFSAEGWIAAGESAPGFPSLLNVYLPNGRHTTLSTELDNVSGVAVAADGTIFASVTGEGRIVSVSIDGTVHTVADGLQWPQGLALSSTGTLYAIVGGEAGGGEGVFTMPLTGDAIIQVNADGSTQTLAWLDRAAGLAVGPDDVLFVVAADGVYRITAPWFAEPFATGFTEARGISFDPEGRLYVADDFENTIIRISEVE